MPVSLTDLEAQALQLPPQDRAQLADRLLASLSPDDDLDEAWAAEADRRLQEMLSGAVVGIPIDDAIARARNALK